MDKKEFPKYPVGKGWWKLLDEYIPKLEQAGADMKNATLPFEKYGTLRIGETNMTDDVMSLLEELEDKSAVTCEYCGAMGSEKTLPNDWIKTLCNDCYKERLEK